jgi:hypothetical protein
MYGNTWPHEFFECDNPFGGPDHESHVFEKKNLFYYF